MSGRCLIWHWLIEFSDVVLSHVASQFLARLFSRKKCNVILKVFVSVLLYAHGRGLLRTGGVGPGRPSEVPIRLIRDGDKGGRGYGGGKLVNMVLNVHRNHKAY